jgi:hypothetical protein
LASAANDAKAAMEALAIVRDHGPTEVMCVRLENSPSLSLLFPKETPCAYAICQDFLHTSHSKCSAGFKAIADDSKNANAVKKSIELVVRGREKVVPGESHVSNI